MLKGISPILTGALLAHLDAMGHSDAVVVVDAHFPAARIAQRLVELPGLSSTAVMRAVGTVLPLDDAPCLDLMAHLDGETLAIHDELTSAAGAADDQIRHLDRHTFYDAARSAYVIVRTGETRTYGNAILRKGVVVADDDRTR
ncbi:transport protein RbsD/FucU [Nakamurella silvestris]|nr:transport protein RbsD/FucU [Nakamurella silvestris]